MSKLVRVKLPATGAHTTVSEAYAKRHNLAPINSPTHDAHGRIRPRVLPKADEADSRKPAPKGDEKKEGGK